MKRIFLFLALAALAATGCNSADQNGANNAPTPSTMPANNPPPSPVTAPPNHAPVP